MMMFRNKIMFTLVALVVLSGCSTSNIMPYGADRFMISASRLYEISSSNSQSKDAVLNLATEHCREMGKQMEVDQLQDIERKEGRLQSVELIFRCIEPL